jgi:hypothetical protein
LLTICIALFDASGKAGPGSYISSGSVYFPWEWSSGDFGIIGPFTNAGKLLVKKRQITTVRHCIGSKIA